MEKTPADLAKQAIDDLYTKYADDPHIFSKMHNYICFKLPILVEDMKRADSERRERNDALAAEQDSFIHSFLNKHQYFYSPQTERFFYYDGVHYNSCKEDDVLHHVLSTITKDRAILLPRKPQTKVYVMKRVKESNPLKSIPESETIQSVLDALCPAIFPTKTAAKYFLSIIGDHLLKKTDETTHVYFATPKAKEYLKELGTLGQIYFGVHATASFKHKYHGHSYKTIRLLKMSDAAAAWRSILLANALDVFCVAAHYSHRYESADNYLEQHSDDVDLNEYTMYFRGKTAECVVGDFTKQFFRVCNKTDTNSEITTATMEYMWRKYLKERQYPTVLSQAVFLNALKSIFEFYYDAENEVFAGITNPSIQTVEKFQRFWGEHLTVDLSSANPLMEYEIGELTALYREETKDKRMNESQMLDLIRFYYPDVQITDNKYIQGVCCDSWNKQEELAVFFTHFCREGIVSFYDAYTIYLREKRRRVASKAYFEKYICCELAEFISADGCLIWSRGEQYKDYTKTLPNEPESADGLQLALP
jgi:hypothetical protein